MSESFAGVTFLAFANGAPDVIAAFVASGLEDGLSLEIGALIGAGFFTITIVFGFCIEICGSLKVEPQEVGRDIAFYILGTAVIIYFAADG